MMVQYKNSEFNFSPNYLSSLYVEIKNFNCVERNNI